MNMKNTTNRVDTVNTISMMNRWIRMGQNEQDKKTINIVNEKMDEHEEQMYMMSR